MSDTYFENNIIAYANQHGTEEALYRLIDVLNDNLDDSLKEFVISDLWG